MDYIARLRFRSSLSAADKDAALMRRAGWKYPDGIDVIAEYWPAAEDLNVVSIFSATDFAPVMQLMFDWNDVFDVDIHPAVSAEQGLAIGPEVFGKLSRLQQA